MKILIPLALFFLCSANEETTDEVVAAESVPKPQPWIMRPWPGNPPYRRELEPVYRTQRKPFWNSRESFASSNRGRPRVVDTFGRSIYEGPERNDNTRTLGPNGKYEGHGSPYTESKEFVDFVEDTEKYKGERVGTLQAALNSLWSHRQEIYSALEDTLLMELSGHDAIRGRSDAPQYERTSDGFYRKPGVAPIPALRQPFYSQPATIMSEYLRPQYTPTRHEPGLERLDESAGGPLPTWIAPPYDIRRWRPPRTRRNDKLQMVKAKNSAEKLNVQPTEELTDMSRSSEIIYGERSHPEKTPFTYERRLSRPLTNPNRMGSASGSYQSGASSSSSSGDLLNSVGTAIGDLADKLPPLDTTVTVMSFLAFTVFVANLAMQAFGNNTSMTSLSFGNLFGKQDATEANLPWGAGPSSNFNQYQFDKSSLSSVLDSYSSDGYLGKVMGVAETVYDNLKNITSLGVSSLRKVMGHEETSNTLQNHYDKDGYHHVSSLLERPQSERLSYSHLEGLSEIEVECIKRVLCQGHRLLAEEGRGSTFVKLLPLWTFGLSWLKGNEPTARLLEDLRAEVAGQSGLECDAIFPQCTTMDTVKTLLLQLGNELGKRGNIMKLEPA